MRRRDVFQYIFEVVPIFSFAYINRWLIKEFCELYEEKGLFLFTISDGYIDSFDF